MVTPSEQFRSGLDYLAAVTALLDRIRVLHPTSGLFDTAEVLWWWVQNARPTDDLGQLFWFDEQGRPEAAVIATRFGESTQLDPLVLPGATDEWRTHVMLRGLGHADRSGISDVYLEVDRTDELLRSLLTDRGFTIDDDGLVETWLDAEAAPAVTELAPGYELADRTTASTRPHHMINARRQHEDPTARMAQTPLYRPDLDLAAYSADGDVAGYGLFWFNPVTEVGVLEPMRVDDDHQQRGIARHLLTSGVQRLVHAGAKRVKIGFEPGNEAARRLYLGSGFVPHRENDLWVGPTGS